MTSLGAPPAGLTRPVGWLLLLLGFGAGHLLAALWFAVSAPDPVQVVQPGTFSVVLTPGEFADLLVRDWLDWAVAVLLGAATAWALLSAREVASARARRRDARRAQGGYVDLVALGATGAALLAVAWAASQGVADVATRDPAYALALIVSAWLAIVVVGLWAS